MPDHLIAAGIGLLAVGCLLAGLVRAWWSAPVVRAIEGLRRDLDVRAYADRIEAEDEARKDPRP